MKNIKAFIFLSFAVFLVISCKSQKETTTSQTENRSEKRKQKGPPSVDEVFKMDSNGDGLLSLQEIDGPLKRDFDKIDLNKDGFISKEELANAPKPQRGQNKPRRK